MLVVRCFGRWFLLGFSWVLLGRAWFSLGGRLLGLVGRLTSSQLFNTFL